MEEMINRKGAAARGRGRHAGLAIQVLGKIKRKGDAMRRRGRPMCLPVSIPGEDDEMRRRGRHAGLPLQAAMIIMAICAGCEKVIDVELNDTNPVIVIEGNLSYSTSDLNIKITKTGSYFSTNLPDAVEGAAVFLEEEFGIKHPVEEEGEGQYRLQRILLKTGTAYRLHVEAEGMNYSASSTLHPPVRIDSLSYECVSETRFFDGGYRLLLYFTDPMGKDDYYRIKVYRNGELMNGLEDLIVFRDDELDGRHIQVRLRRQTFAAGDTARVDLLTLDRGAWLYYSTLREIADLNPGSPAPANPVSNFDNGALGYFSAWSGSTATMYIGDKTP
jgi:hypothetical protein